MMECPDQLFEDESIPKLNNVRRETKASKSKREFRKQDLKGVLNYWRILK